MLHLVQGKSISKRNKETPKTLETSKGVKGLKAKSPNGFGFFIWSKLDGGWSCVFVGQYCSVGISCRNTSQPRLPISFIVSPTMWARSTQMMKRGCFLVPPPPLAFFSPEQQANGLFGRIRNHSSARSSLRQPCGSNPNTRLKGMRTTGLHGSAPLQSSSSCTTGRDLNSFSEASSGTK